MQLENPLSASNDLQIATEHVELSRKGPHKPLAKYLVFPWHLFLRHTCVSNMVDSHNQFTNVQIIYRV